MPNIPFSGLGAPVSVAGTGVSASGALPGVGGESILVNNQGATPVHFRVGPSATIGAAVLADQVVAAGTTQVFSMPKSVPGYVIDTVACIFEGAGAANVEFQRGAGS